ncbi:MAG TPA: polyprenyl diphosphate synthase [Burkholderiaceae bacterium]|nr:polyprenyl diphosphate synthase [Burkholderiaceae bacterium]
MPAGAPAASQRKPGVPRHVAIIMDGNGRWAKARHLPRVAGHSRGVERVRTVIEASISAGVEYLSLFAFSSENWQRPADEVSVLMRLFVSSLQREIDALVRNGVRLRVVGQIDAFEARLREQIAKAQEQSAHNTRLHLTICASYGGRWDIVQAAQRLVAAHQPGAPLPGEEQFARELSMAFAPDPDLLIRTGGERRISNFLIWQLAYAELFFTDVLWPDFQEEAFADALAWYAQRERRFGRTSEQLVRTG